MVPNITSYETFRNTQFSYHGMDADYATRNMASMVAIRLKELRKRAGKKQDAIAAEIGVSVPQISRWENGVDAFPSSRLDAFEAAYQCTASEIFTESSLAQRPEIYAPRAQTIEKLLQAAKLVGQPARAPKVDALDAAHAIASGLKQLARDPSIEDDESRMTLVLHFVAEKAFETRPTRDQRAEHTISHTADNA